MWACVSQRYCAPCFRLSRWFDDNHDVLKKDFVILKIDELRNANGHRVADRLLRGQRHGFPYHAIFDQHETMLVDSAGLFGNIGAPSRFEGRKQLAKMLATSKQQLNDIEIQGLLNTIE